MTGAAVPLRRDVGAVEIAARASLALGVVLVGWFASRWGSPYAVFWAFGLAFGFVLQRSRFCFASAFRDLFLFGSSATMKGILAGMAVAAVGFTLLQSKMVARPGLGIVPPEAHVFPLGPHLIVGGLLFGVGMVLAGGCVSGTLYRMGEGYLASYASFAGILVGLALAAHSWNFWWERSIRPGAMVWLPERLGYAGALAVTLLALAAVWLVLEVKEAGGAGLLPVVAAASRREGPPAGPGGALVRPSGQAQHDPAGPHAKAGAARVRLSQLARQVFKDGWPPMVGGVLLGVLNVYVYLAHMPLGVTGELSRWAVGLSRLVGLAPPPLQGADQLPGCTLVMGGSALLSHSLMLDLGLIAGSLLAAVLAGEFRLRRAPRRRWVQSGSGGVLMGYGAGIAGGCTIGAFFSAIPSLGLNGWLFGLSLLAGAGAGTRLIRRLA